MTRRSMGLLLIASGVLGVCLGGNRTGHDHAWPLRQQDTVDKVFSVSATPARLVVENLSGYVHVKAGAGNQVRISAKRTVRAGEDRDFQQALHEVQLDMQEQSGTVTVTYNAPWVCRGENSSGCNHSERRFYDVSYDIDIEVPKAIRPYVSTVNRGDVRVEGTTGEYEVRNVNGPVTLVGIIGSGVAHTVNGPITARFAQNPASASEFKTVNGPIDIYLPGDLSADLEFQTMHGEIYSDFDVVPSTAPTPAGERRGARFIYRSSGMKRARAGSGGPTLSFATINGEIRLHRGSVASSQNGVL